MVDCSHANSLKQHAKQEEVWTSIIEQRTTGNRGLIGAMIESNIHEGSQPIPKDRAELKYGVSITDACLGWEATERMLRQGHELLAAAGRPVVAATFLHVGRCGAMVELPGDATYVECV